MERADSARKTIDIITELLDKYGQGGPCSNEPGREGWASHYSFVAADHQGAWLLESAGKYWAAVQITGQGPSNQVQGVGIFFREENILRGQVPYDFHIQHIDLV